MTTNRTRRDIRHVLDDLDAISAPDTRLISLYVPESKSIPDVASRMQQEQSEAGNIKSKATRRSVENALNAIVRELRAVSESDGGIVLFAGYVNDVLIQHTITDVPINSFRYECGKSFVTDDLRRSIDDRDVYGLIVIERRAASIGRLNGDRVVHDQTLESNAKGKHNAGGFSNRRFDRLIEEETDNFYDDVAAAFDSTMRDVDLDGVIVGGTNITKDEFAEQLRTEYRNMLLGTYAVEYTGQSGLEQLVRCADAQIEDSRTDTARRSVSTFFERLRDDDRVTYGVDEVERATELGAVDELLLSDTVERQHTELQDDVEAMGGSVTILPTTFEDGQRFDRGFDGVGALLRYPV